MQTDENGAFCGISGAGRVRNITVNGEPLAPEKEYRLAGDEHLLRYGAPGYAMFSGARSAKDLDMTVIDAMTLYLRR